MSTKLNGYRFCFNAVDRRLLLKIVLLLVLILSASKYLIHLVAWKISGPISLMIGFVFLSYFLRKHAMSWADLGLKNDKFYKHAIWFIMVAVGSVGVILIAHQAADYFFDKPAKSTERFGDLAGNIPLTLAWIITGIVVGGFGEELIYRGFLINALERVIDKKYGLVIAVVFPALFWAVRHYYYSHGYGSVMVFVMGLFFGMVYVINGRNLYPGIILHALFDTLSFLARYEGS